MTNACRHVADRWLLLGALAVTWAAAAPAWALDALVEKKVFSLSTYSTVGGVTLRNVRVGYETYGRLNGAKDNVIFIAHMFLGTSHAAGRYKSNDAEPGYWDAIIGPGKPIDTERYFVVSADSLAHTNARDPNVVTTGPLSIDPDSGRPYGTRFPLIALRDHVAVHKALLDSLGIRRVHAVAGWSMGAMQAYDWAAAYPGYVQRVVAVGGSAQPDAYAIGWLNIWAQPVLLDARWKQGNYAAGEEPEEGLAASIRALVQTVAHHGWIDGVFGNKWAAEGKDPATAMDHGFAWESQLAAFGQQFGPLLDANSYLLNLKAIQTFVVGRADSVEAGLAKIKAPVLVVGTPTDVLVIEPTLKRDVEILRRNGLKVRYVPLEGPMGHLEGRFGIARAGDAIREFLLQ